MHSRARRITAFLAIALPALIALALVAGFLGAWHPAFDSFAHFRAHLAVLLALAGLPGLFIGYWKEAIAAVALGVAALSTTAVDMPVPGFGASVAEPRPDDVAIYRLMQLNLLYNNPEPEKALSEIGRVQPDIVTLEEVSATWGERLKLLAPTYPYSVICPAGRRVGGVAIFSRRPFTFGTEPVCLLRGSLAIASVDLGGRTLDVAAVHLAWPWPRPQAQEVAELEAELARLADNALLAGDFNAVGWSQTLKRVAAAGRLTPVPPVGPTWLAYQFPLAFRAYVGLPIDHVLSKGNVHIHAARTGGDAGSDHAPVIVEFSLSGSAPNPPEEADETVTAKLGR